MSTYIGVDNGPRGLKGFPPNRSVVLLVLPTGCSYTAGIILVTYLVLWYSTVTQSDSAEKLVRWSRGQEY